MVRSFNKSAVILTLLFLSACAAEDAPLSATAQNLQNKKFVDLTHAFDVDTPHWKGFTAATRKMLYDYKKDGFRVEEFSHVGQWGTHVDPPGHFAEGGTMVDAIPLKDMVMPLVVLDVHDKVAKNPDYVLSMDDIAAWESMHGEIPEGSFVAMRTDWSKRWPSQKRMQNADHKGVNHYPGWSKETLKFLYEVRHITASGHETTDTDPGLATTHDDYSLEAYILKSGHYQIELLTNLDQVPEAGGMVVATWPKFKNGSGFPARIFAVVEP